MLETIKTVGDITAYAVSALGIIAAGVWFVYTSQYKQRIQFDVECTPVFLPHNTTAKLIEVAFAFENKGFIEHHLWNLNLSVHSLDDETKLTSKSKTGEVEFNRQVLAKTQLVPKKYGYYFVRPGVSQIITHIIEVPTSVSVIRITASFDYQRDGQYPHTVRRIFDVK